MAQRITTQISELVGRRISELRKTHKLQQADLAVALKREVSRSLISYIETGRSFPKPERLADLAAVLEVDVASFFLDSGEFRKRIALKVLATDDTTLLRHVGKLLDLG
jgi:transcriptional regulator with XRE-family HTH domain